jgi:hypothetical protein
MHPPVDDRERDRRSSPSEFVQPFWNGGESGVRRSSTPSTPIAADEDPERPGSLQAAEPCDVVAEDVRASST